MEGKAAVNNVELSLLHELATSLATSFPGIKYQHCRREENRVADQLANSAREDVKHTMGDELIYYPARFNLIDAWVEGVKVLASHDLGCASDEKVSMIDASFLRELPGGVDLFRNMAPCPRTFLNGHDPMNVLGVVTVQADIQWHASRMGVTRISCAVVESLPVPVHVRCGRGGFPQQGGTGCGKSFNAEGLPARYRTHRLRGDHDSAFIGLNMSS